MHAYLKVASLMINTSTNSAGNPVNYLAQPQVIKEQNTTTKLGIFFNASSKQKRSTSLSDCFISGPSRNPKLAAALLRFMLCLIYDSEGT